MPCYPCLTTMSTDSPHEPSPTAVCVPRDPRNPNSLLPSTSPPILSATPNFSQWIALAKRHYGCLLISSQVSEAVHCLPSPAALFRQKALGPARPLLQAARRQIHYMAHSDQLCMNCSDNQGPFFWALPDREQSWLFTALKAPHLLLRPTQGHWAKIHLSCRPSFLKRKPMVRRLRVGGVERTQAR